jgi:hypothetical protein
MLATVRTPKRRPSYYGIALPKDCGSFNDFYLFSKRKRVAFKTFQSRFHAFKAWRRQQILSENNLAPRVHSDVCRMTRLRDGIKTKTGWGYVTEIVKTIPPYKWATPSKSRVYHRKADEVTHQIRVLTGWYFNDNHLRNVGWTLRNGKRCWMCIDTGCEGFSTQQEWRDKFAQEYQEKYGVHPDRCTA